MLRLDELYRYKENYMNKINRQLNHDSNNKSLILIRNFLLEIKNGPDLPCVCCDNIFFLRSVLIFNKNKIETQLKSLNIDIKELLRLKL